PPGCPAVAVDSALNIYIAGSTTSTDFPTAGSPFQASNAGGADAFITKLDPAGATILFSTYLGGDGRDTPSGVAVDSASNVAVAGTTTSTNFPTSSSPIPGPQSGTHAFVSEVDSAGQTLLYSTYLAGDGIDAASGLAEDVRGKLSVTATTTPPPSCTPTPGSTDAFLAKFNLAAASGAQLVYSTYIGGAGNDVGYAVAADTGNAYITGSTTSSDFVIPSGTTPFQNANKGGGDAFVAKFGNPSTSSTTTSNVPLGI